MYYSLIRLAQKTLDAQQHTARVQGRTPRSLFALASWLQNVQAYPAAEVDVGVIDGSLEEDFGRCIWVVRGVGDGELEGQVLVGRVLWSFHGGVPLGHVVGGKGADAGGRRGHEGHEFRL